MKTTSWVFTFIDGLGRVHEVKVGDEWFDAVGVSMGLLGVVSLVRLRVRRSYNVVGQQRTTTTGADCPIDLFGEGDGDRPSLQTYLRSVGYSRLMWWPQNNFYRIQAWEADRIDPTPDFEPEPYLELGKMPRVAALAGSLLYTIIGKPRRPVAGAPTSSLTGKSTSAMPSRASPTSTLACTRIRIA